MSFEYREIIADSDDMRLGVIISDNKPEMLSLVYTFNNEEESIDNDSYLKYTLYNSLGKYVYGCDLTDEDKEAIDFLGDDTHKKELYEMFVRAETLGWMADIERLPVVG